MENSYQESEMNQKIPIKITWVENEDGISEPEIVLEKITVTVDMRHHQFLIRFGIARFDPFKSQTELLFQRK